ncbi:dienelactone hydrolase family protein [Balneolales bacterium ANBcel1]|nr:dienelactone hydrolase family protein [Balneolales bacterium ANBcel1]
MFQNNDHPHQGQPVLEKGKPLDQAKGAVILIHGRGASADSILTLYDELMHLEESAGARKEGAAGARKETTAGSQVSAADPQNGGASVADLAWMAPQAANHTWYPYPFMSPLEQNEPWLESALQVMDELITKALGAGIPKERIVLAGFSQGACLSTEFAARNADRYGGVVALSGGVIGPDVDYSRYRGSMKKTPVFIGCSDIDSHIPEHRVQDTAGVFENLGADVTKKIYPGMGHTVNEDELHHFRNMLHNLPV